MVYDGIDSVKYIWRIQIMTFVELSDFSATSEGPTRILNWISSTERNNAGFIVLASATENGEFCRLHEGLLIPNHTGRYQYVDRRMEFGERCYYKLQAIALDGSVQEFGPIAATVAAPSNCVWRKIIPIRSIRRPLFFMKWMRCKRSMWPFITCAVNACAPCTAAIWLRAITRRTGMVATKRIDRRFRPILLCADRQTTAADHQVAAVEINKSIQEIRFINRRCHVEKGVAALLLLLSTSLLFAQSGVPTHTRLLYSDDLMSEGDTLHRPDHYGGFGKWDSR